jgi:hypothetical protein
MAELPRYAEQAARAEEIMRVMSARMDRLTAELEAEGWTVERFENTVILKHPGHAVPERETREPAHD